MDWTDKLQYKIRILETHEDMKAVNGLQLEVWGDEGIVPLHLLITIAHNGGLVLGAFVETRLVGFVFGFPGLVDSPNGPRTKHCSHMLGVCPDCRSQGVGFALKRAQWQMVRRQGLDQITWTYDPLLSNNAYLNVSRLGTVCNTYFRAHYGEMDDNLNAGLPSDRFQVELWVNSPRVTDRMSKRPRCHLDLAHYLSGGAEIINPTQLSEDGWPRPPESPWVGGAIAEKLGEVPPPNEDRRALYLLEIPANLLALKAANQELALVWRLHTRMLFEDLFERGYLVTDFLYLRGTNPRSFYVLSHGERMLG